MVDLIENSGNSPDEAIVILGARSSSEAIDAEYAHLEKLFGKIQRDWQLRGQQLLPLNGHYYDVFTVEIGPADVRRVFFDISELFSAG